MRNPNFKPVNLPLLIAIFFGLWVGSYVTMRIAWTQTASLAGKTGTAQRLTSSATPASGAGGTARRALVPIRSLHFVKLPVSGTPGDALARAANLLYYPLLRIEWAFSGGKPIFEHL